MILTNKHLKIAHFGHKRMPSREGGIEIVVEELTTRMAQLGHEVTCINRRGHHVSGTEFDGERLDEYKGVKIISVPTMEKRGFAALSSAFFASIKTAFGTYVIVHIHAEGPAAFCWLPKFMKKRVICTCHGIDWRRPKWYKTLGGKFIKFGEKMMALYADEIIVLSKDTQQYFINEYGRETVYIPNGVNKPVFFPTNLIYKKWNLKKDTYILILARLTKEKNIHLLIEIYKNLNTDKKLVVAGGSSDSEEYVNQLYELADNNPNIIFTGFVHGQVLEELYSNAYIYCLPSELEGMPLSLLEAMSYGNCCLVSDIPECVEVVEDKAVVFRLDKDNDFRNKLQRLCDDENLVKKYKTCSAEFICSKYNWNHIVEQTLMCYEKLKD